MVPEGNGTKDYKATLRDLDILCHAIKEDREFEPVHNIIFLSGNDGTYSSNAFHVASFDVAKLYGL